MARRRNQRPFRSRLQHYPQRVGGQGSTSSRSTASRFAAAAVSALGVMIVVPPTIAVAQDAPAQANNAGPPDVSVLPYPPPPFKGIIGRTTADSKSDFPQPVTAPEGAPNVLLILTDDVGFGASSAFGGPIPTPTFERLRRAASSTTASTPPRSVLRPARR